MTAKPMPHPCLSCILPDCDDRSLRCQLRKALNAYDHALRAGTPISDELRQRRSVAYNEFYGIIRNARRKAVRSEVAQ